MAGPMNQARAKISKIFNGEPRSYTRFNLAQNADGESSHVEVKLSDVAEEEVDGTELGHHHPDRTYTKGPQRTYKKILYAAVLILIVFLAGYLVGYVTHRKPQASQQSESKAERHGEGEGQGDGDGVGDGDGDGVGDGDGDEGDADAAVDDAAAAAPAPALDWSDITEMLKNGLTSAAFDEQLSNFALADHMAGSSGDERLANKVMNIFKNLEMAPWTDEHYVKLQVPSGNRMNKVFLGAAEIGPNKGYLAYSGTGTKQGKVVYANYGQMEDLKVLGTANVNVKDSVVLMRTGKISLAEKVANVAKAGAAAALIYPEPKSNSDLQTELYGHVHFGTGDPYTPGFPSFNHTQFPPARSSGLPEVLAQTITAKMALKIHENMGGKDAPVSFKGGLDQLSKYTLGGEGDPVNVTVNNVLVDTKIHNVFGVIKGFIDPDRYVVIGAQRDSFTQGYAKSTVGTCLLVELAKAIAGMKKAGFRPRRSIVFASWSAGDFGSVGATEWLEGYLPSLDKRAFTYISLDGVVLGQDKLKASASPLLQDLLKDTLKGVKNLASTSNIPFPTFSTEEFESSVLEPMQMEDGAYPFLAFSGIPSVSFRFVPDGDYRLFGTALDSKENLGLATKSQVSEYCVSAAQVAGQMALRLVHDHILRLDVTSYTSLIRKHVVSINTRVNQLKRSGNMDAPLTPRWLMSALGSYSRAAADLKTEIKESDLEDNAKCRSINDRIMRVEHNWLSQYISPRDVPFRHIFFGTGDCAVSALKEHLQDLKEQAAGADADLMRNQFALTTWTIQSCANDLAGDVWSLDNEI